MVRDIDKHLEDLSVWQPGRGPLLMLCDIAEHAAKVASQSGVPTPMRLTRAITAGRDTGTGKRQGRLRTDDIDETYDYTEPPTQKDARERARVWLNRLAYHIVCATWGPASALVAGASRHSPSRIRSP